MKAARWMAVGWVAAAFVVGGCSEPPPPQAPTEEATVKGKVTMRGKAIRNGEVVFTPVVPRGVPEVEPRKAPLGSDGSYTVKTLVGPNSVKVRGPAIAKDAAFAENEKVVDVAPGDNTIAVTMP